MRTRQHQFLLDLFGECEAEHYICIWRRDNKLTRRFKVADIDAAAVYARETGETTDVYVGCGLQPEDGPENERGKARSVCCIMGAWADIDVGSHGNGKKYLPTLDAATRFLDTLPVKPTKVVATGGGVHAWWLFKEPWVIDSDEERLSAQQCVGRWQMLLRRQLGKYDLDSTFDLARVLRIPGTFNHKGDEKTGVVLLVDDGARCNPSDLLEFAPEVTVTISDSMESETGKAIEVVIRADAEPPGNKLGGMLDDDKFKHSWEKTRKDMPNWTPSEYCLSIANMTAIAGWSNQEIADTLIAWRRRHCPDRMKLDRADWFMERITTARKAVGVTESKQVSLEILSEARQGEKVPEQELLASVSKIVGFRILGLIKRMLVDEEAGTAEDPTYVLDMEPEGKGPVKIAIPTVDHILDQLKFRRIAANHASMVVTRMKGNDWDNVAQALIKSATEVADVPEAGNLETVRSFLRRYLTHAIVSPSMADAAGADSVVHEDDGSVLFPWSGFSTWALGQKTLKMTNADLARSLKGIKCTRVTYDKKVNGVRVKATFWRTPVDF